MNSATDNPMVFATGPDGEGELISGGNFHAAPVALVFDMLTAAATDLASISERRTERLVNPTLSGDLPAFLVEQGGLNSGFMMIHVTAAALVSECKSNSFPASVDSIPTSAGKEDHVSMGPIAARKLARNVDEPRERPRHRAPRRRPGARPAAPAPLERPAGGAARAPEGAGRPLGRGPLRGRRHRRGATGPRHGDRRPPGGPVVGIRTAIPPRPARAGRRGGRGAAPRSPPPRGSSASGARGAAAGSGGRPKRGETRLRRSPALPGPAGRSSASSEAVRSAERSAEETMRYRASARSPRIEDVPLAEAVVEPVERPEEVGEVGEEAEAEVPVGEVQDERRAAGGSREGPGEERVASQEPAEGVVLEELDHPLRRLQEVDAARGGSGVEDDPVDGGVVRVLGEGLDPHVLDDAGQGADEAVVEAVLVDPLQRRRGRHAREEPLERRPGVDLHHPERGPAGNAARPTGRSSDPERPSAWARRRAGSTVRTSVLCPVRAEAIPTAAARVVLPTPPGPARTTSRSSRSASSRSRFPGPGGAAAVPAAPGRRSAFERRTEGGEERLVRERTGPRPGRSAPPARGRGGPAARPGEASRPFRSGRCG